MENVSKKDKALELMKRLDLFDGFIKDFKEKDLVCYFERFAGFWDYQNKELEAKRKEIEKKYNCLVYAITHEFLEGDELYSFLLVTNYPEEWKYSLVDAGSNKFYATAYVWNKSCDWCSEFGDVVVESAFGGLRRVA
ncbi:MAG: hypothetical protein NC114_08835 [Ruminococcus flavefaciens]|nr:hypothetical protein [Ruminococcus flavefaciens]